jgi:prepilin-type processing-associated H-X9-DG protein
MTKRFSAFTRIELLVVVAVCAVILFILLAALRPPRNVSSRLTCSVNLKQLAFADQTFEKEHAGYPWMVSTNQDGTQELALLGEEAFRHCQVLSNEIYVTLGLICPQDTRRAATNWANLANTNVSYFTGLDARTNQPTTILAGDRNITSASSVVLLTSPSTPPHWVDSVGLHGDKGHLAFGDGHVEELNSEELAKAVQNTGVATNHFAVP